MDKDVFTFIVGGKAGEGTKKAGSVAAKLFSSMGRFIFEMDDYMSLIRGGHNFSVVSTATRKIFSHYMKADLLVVFDKRSYDLHKHHLADNGIIVFDSNISQDIDGVGIPLRTTARKYPKSGLSDLIMGVGAVASLVAVLGLDKEYLKNLIMKEYPINAENNVSYAIDIYDLVYSKIGKKFIIENGDKKRQFLSGNEAIGLGAVAGGLDIYFAYPMTPSTSLLHFLARYDNDFGLTVVHPENEIAVINMAIGATITGAKAMVGSSGGGFTLMQEAFSLAGMVEAPILCVLSARSSPSTGVPTYTEQAELNFALNAGHGEFPRFVACPGTVEEAFYLTAEMMDLIWRFQTPGILLTEKHMSESSMSVELNIEKAKWYEPLLNSKDNYERYLDSENGVSPLSFPPSKQLIKWNSYEHDALGITTEEPDLIIKMNDKRNRKRKTIVDHMRNLHTVNKYGDKGPKIFSIGSSTMSILEALKIDNLEATVIQPIYLKPLPVWELEKYQNEDIIVVEQNSTGQLATLLKEKVGLKVKTIIKKYDGRPFDPFELIKNLKEAI
jgi:2-oxoglutarate ferredoxin oxidoreductase subunit alpha